jgi:DNA-binding transcriptional ArsR family regulator
LLHQTNIRSFIPIDFLPNASTELMNSISKLLKILSHSIRRRIIKCLEEQESLSFNDLLKLVNTKNHGELGFHLRALKGLIEKKSSDEYSLTNKGLLAAGLLDDISLILSRTTQDLLSSPIRYIRGLVLGDHAFFLSDSETDKKDALFSYLKAGLAKGEAAVFFAREQKLDSYAHEIQRHGISPEYIDKKALNIMSAEEWYINKGKAHAQTIISNWTKLVKAKQKARFLGLRGAGEMEVFFDYAKTRELLTYERMLGRKLAFNLCALCIYDANRLDERQFRQMVTFHGHVVSKDIAYKLT